MLLTLRGGEKMVKLVVQKNKTKIIRLWVKDITKVHYCSCRINTALSKYYHINIQCESTGWDQQKCSKKRKAYTVFVNMFDRTNVRP